MKYNEVLYDVFDSMKHLEGLLKEVDRLRYIEEKYNFVEDRLREYKDAANELGVHQNILKKIEENDIPF